MHLTKESHQPSAQLLNVDAWISVIVGLCAVCLEAVEQNQEIVLLQVLEDLAHVAQLFFGSPVFLFDSLNVELQLLQIKFFRQRLGNCRLLLLQNLLTLQILRRLSQLLLSFLLLRHFAYELVLWGISVAFKTQNVVTFFLAEIIQHCVVRSGTGSHEQKQVVRHVRVEGQRQPICQLGAQLFWRTIPPHPSDSALIFELSGCQGGQVCVRQLQIVGFHPLQLLLDHETHSHRIPRFWQDHSFEGGKLADPDIQVTQNVSWYLFEGQRPIDVKVGHEAPQRRLAHNRTFVDSSKDGNDRRVAVELFVQQDLARHELEEPLSRDSRLQVFHDLLPSALAAGGEGARHQIGEQKECDGEKHLCRGHDDEHRKRDQAHKIVGRDFEKLSFSTCQLLTTVHLSPQSKCNPSIDSEQPEAMVEVENLFLQPSAQARHLLAFVLAKIRNVGRKLSAHLFPQNPREPSRELWVLTES
mmetsp:Transcript_51530/g.137517  ORF Transcript_51530/g.137517 Transcript_51530/m.137517 type:complete len:470 (+) Transcript_51530:561-1970(+)